MLGYKKNKILIFVILFLSFNVHELCGKSFMVFGGERGWIGQKLVVLLRQQGHEAHPAQSRLEHRAQIEQEINMVNPDYIINAAGIIGKPSVNWCESHKQETVRANVLGLLNLVDIAFLRGIHVTNIATGCIYQYDNKHPLASGIGFTEDEEPNFTGSFYSLTKVMVEKMIGCYPNTLNLRLRMPISDDLHPRSFIGKIINYKKLINIPNSMSIVEDLLPLIPVMIERGLVGNYNFVNSGVISHNQIIELYKKYINPNHQYENFTVEEQDEILKVPRSNCELSVDKLLKQFPGIPHIQDSIVQVFLRINQNKKESNEVV